MRRAAAPTSQPGPVVLIVWDTAGTHVPPTVPSFTRRANPGVGLGDRPGPPQIRAKEKTESL